MSTFNGVEKFYLTTAIDYINAKPHIGHAYEKVAADVLARYYSAKLGKDKLRFLTGTDEHGAKIEKAAEAAKKPLEDFARETAATFSFAWDQLNVVPDRFIRTTDQDHIKTVEDLLIKIKDNGYLYESEYEGYYCTACETFYTQTDVPSHICPVHNAPLELIKEKNWFLKISEFIPKIKKKIETEDFIWPESAKNEILSWIEKGFNDIAISRPNVKWGIPLPWDKTQTVYVWVDALINYVTGAKVNGENWWPANLHIIGRDISKFHCIIWPAILLAAGLEMPNKVAVHGYLTVGGKKMSKSVGNVIDPNEWVIKYGADAVRYLLLREVAFGQDGDVSEEKLKIRYEGELANGLGNLVSRITTLVEKYLDGRVKNVTPFEGDDGVNVMIEEFKFHDALAKIWEWVAWGNKAVDENKLWELGKSDVKKFEEISSQVLSCVLTAAIHLRPFLPETSQKIQDIISAEKIVKAEPLFPKII
jgi:methionyl-tRNA synthetase